MGAQDSTPPPAGHVTSNHMQSLRSLKDVGHTGFHRGRNHRGLKLTSTRKRPLDLCLCPHTSRKHSPSSSCSQSASESPTTPSLPGEAGAWQLLGVEPGSQLCPICCVTVSNTDLRPWPCHLCSGRDKSSYLTVRKNGPQGAGHSAPGEGQSGRRSARLQEACAQLHH